MKIDDSILKNIKETTFLFYSLRLFIQNIDTAVTTWNQKCLSHWFSFELLPFLNYDLGI